MLTRVKSCVAGFAAYLVGGCVRDLLLKRVPKDFDVITTASLQQIKKIVFQRCIIIGKRFPICQVNMYGTKIEVSSFSTNTNDVKGTKDISCSNELKCCDKGDILLWQNSMKRDFTINGLFFNPFNSRIYDYVNGVRDIRKNKVCTVIPASVSFDEDPARILRGLRIAARLGFEFSSETSSAIRELSSSIRLIDKARLMMEMNYLLSYGAAESSLRLLRKYGLLNMLLPFQAAYFSDQMKDKSNDRDLMLMKLLANLDKLLSADRPCSCCLWAALLTFHSALVNSPQDAQVIRAFGALMYFGSWGSTVNFLNQDIGAPTPFIPETLGPSQSKLDNLMEQTSHLASLVKLSVDILTSLDALEQSLDKYSEASQFSGLVLVSRRERERVLVIFEGLDSDLTSYERTRGMHEIDYRLLKNGDPDEVRFVLGKVIMDTMSEVLPCASTEYHQLNKKAGTGDLADGSNPSVSLSTLFSSKS
ncbi:poly(A) polymerase I-like isoform X2 [Oryza brachyantha]|uniref:poly(A) polymerase I-like isoform X2 n=1 Tax=Oryza brachyantha TaxID=4533 RepID=UPI001ADC786C|nr:poly(A) polymerase I-like isoform X2 [Oryza brachyantha]XP_040378191.1 poly(A) polymerase I-like isoform X2 [Oryza brachyantha]